MARLDGPIDPVVFPQLIDLLVSDPAPRGAHVLPDSFAWSSGGFVHGGVAGVRTHARLYPAVSRYLTKLVQAVLPDFRFSTVTLLRDLMTPVHIDAHNEQGTLNALIAVSSFEGGGLWVADSSGCEVRDVNGRPMHGRVLHFQDTVPCKSLIFDAHVHHCTEPWQGSRVVLAAYTVRGMDKLTCDDRRVLSDAGFCLEPAEMASVAVVDVPKSPSCTKVACKPFHGTPVVIELFAGTARVTACLHALGLVQSFGVDHQLVAGRSGKVVVCDLTTPEGQQLTRHWLRHPSVQGIFAAPPCGTCSAARKIRNGGPPPLRSERFPDGFQHLRGEEAARVSSANTLYSFLASLVLEAHALNLPIAVENPRGSLFWKTSFWEPCNRVFTFTACQACAYGGRRPKWTAFQANSPLSSIAFVQVLYVNNNTFLGAVMLPALTATRRPWRPRTLLRWP